MRKTLIPSHRFMMRNILHVYTSCSPTELVQGAIWYPTVTARCSAIAETHGLHAHTVAAVIAALSPQLPWHRNLEAACDIINGRPIATGAGNPIPSNISKARAILRDNALSPVGYFLDAPKVESFARNISGDMSVVTVDVHALQIALGSPRVSIGLKRHAYSVIAEAYHTTAVSIGIEPATLQAVTWCRWKALYPGAVKRNHMREDGRITSWAGWVNR